MYGRQKAAEELKMPESSVRNYMDTLKKLKILDIKSDNKFSVISIVNWELYQCDEGKEDFKSDNNRTINGQQQDTNKKGKKGKKDKKILYTSDFIKFYDIYPNPQNKQQSFKNWKTCLKDHSIDELLKAAENYKYSVEGRARQYIKTSSNFLGRDKFYIDYLPQNYKEVEQPRTRGW